MQTPGCKISLESHHPLIATASFSPDFPAFSGHFPAAAGGPILPGFLHIQLALKVLQLARLPNDLREIREAKFLGPILPAATILIEVMPAPEPLLYSPRLAGGNASDAEKHFQNSAFAVEISSDKHHILSHFILQVATNPSDKLQ